ncbi:MAG TPA: antibiotic biosynthesis monooxygenase [Cellvibrionaceae bacterium]
MLVVIFEVIPIADGVDEYLAIAERLKNQLKDIPGFISIERFQSLNDSTKILSLSFWEHEEAIAHWRNLEAHRLAQARGRNDLFADYRIRVGSILRDYSLAQHQQAPLDSQAIHATPSL